jgi:membrane associated rhomboid family serine protease
MVMPIGDDDSQLNITPIVTIGLIIANLIVFVIELSQGNLEGFFLRWSVVPIEYSELTDFPPTHAGPVWTTLFSSMFMHAGFAHLFGNMLFLWIFGDNVEEAMGHLRFLVFYLVCGVGAAFAQIGLNIDSQIPSLGASGAIALWIFFQLISGIGQLAQVGETGGVAYGAHVGGFVAGLVLVRLFRDPQRRSPARVWRG